MEESLILDGVRSIFAMLDRMVYSLIAIFYNTIMDLANVQILKTSEVNSLTSRIYALIGIFMIFKVSFSLITYLVDPDKIMDKSQGTGTLIKNIVITFVLIISTPFAFDLLYEAQSAILSDQIIPKFIFGSAIESSNADMSGKGYTIRMNGDKCSDINVENMGNYIGLAIFKPFFVPEQRDPLNGLPAADMNWYCTAGCTTEATCNDSKLPSVSNLLSRSDLYNAPKGISFEYNYDIDYSFFLSTAVGVVVALIFLGFCFDIATRVLRLLFLEIIAPIPIMSYIDPNSAKSGTFSKWLKEVSGTWVSLFTRLASVFLAVYVIQKIASGSDLYFSSGYEFGGSATWLKLLLIIGSLIFAKQLPKMMEDVLGFKLGGNMTLNPFKKLEGEALGAKQIATGAGMVTGAAVGAVGGAAANAWAASVNNKNAMKKLAEDPNNAQYNLADKKWGDLTRSQKSILREQYLAAGGRTGFGNARSVIAGGSSAGARAVAAGHKSGKFTPFKNATAGITDSSTARTRRASGYGIKSQIVDKATDMAHIPQSYGTTSILKNRKKAQEIKMQELMARNEALRDQAAYLRSQNPNSSLAYNEAGKVKFVEDADGKQKREYEYKTYDEYHNKWQERYNAALASASNDPDELEKVKAIGELSKEEFVRARAYDDEIYANKEAIDAAQKEISKIDENMKKDK